MNLDPGHLNDVSPPVAAGQSPMLPIEGPLVACVLRLRTVADKASESLALLQYLARDREAVFRALQELRAAAEQAEAAYANYDAIRLCEGQA